LVSGWQLAAAAEAGGAATAAGVVRTGAGAGGAAACDEGVVVRTRGGVVVFCTAAAACVACWLGNLVAFAELVAVAEELVVRPTAVPLDDEGDPPEFTTAMTEISAAKPKTPVSTLWLAGQDLPRGRRGAP
jgi:hypothetical protein